MQYKSISLTESDLKFDTEKKGTFTGYGSVWDSVDLVGDTVIKGAFQESIKKYTPKMFMNHDSWEIPIGSWKHIEEDSKGLLCVGEINLQHKDGPSLHSALERKDMDSLSIGFGLDEFKQREDGGRDLLKINLREISVVTFPCEPKATISDVKSLETVRDIEKFLRDAGFSKNEAMAAVSHFKRILLGEPVKDEFNEEIKRLNFKLSCQSLIQTLEKL